MLPSFLTAILWAFSAVCANRVTRLLGSLLTNLLRLFFAAIILGFWAHVFGKGLSGDSLWFFILSGCVGFGFGDLACLEGFSLIGPRLTILLTQCLAAPIAGLIELVWLGTLLTAPQIIWGMVILSGVALALSPQEHRHLQRNQLWLGCLWGVLSAFGQGFGAVLSRKAFEIAQGTGLTIDGGTAAYQRSLGGLGIIFVAYAMVRFWQRREKPSRSFSLNWSGARSWLAGHVFAGPVIGVSCFQWALATNPSAIVLPIVATTPLAVIPMSYFIDGERPNIRSLIGGAIAVLGAAALALTSQ
jgi:drug/metabolite transporter (DMT)-like permease